MSNHLFKSFIMALVIFIIKFNKTYFMLRGIFLLTFRKICFKHFMSRRDPKSRRNISCLEEYFCYFQENKFVALYRADIYKLSDN